MVTPPIRRRVFAFVFLITALPLAAQTTGTAPANTAAPADAATPTTPVKPSAPPLTEAQLLGTWLSVQRSAGGLGETLTFLPSGKVEASTGVVVETWYKVEGDRLITPPSTTLPGAKSEIHVFRVEGDTLYQHIKDENIPEQELNAARAKALSAGITDQQFDALLKKELVLSRVGTTNAGDLPIVGVWKMPDTADVVTNLTQGLAKAGKPMNPQIAQAMAKMIGKTSYGYTRDGLLLLCMPMMTYSAYYDLGTQTITPAKADASASAAPNTGHFDIVDGLLVITADDGKTKEAFIRSTATKEELKHAGVTYGGKPPQLDPPVNSTIQTKPE